MLSVLLNRFKAIDLDEMRPEGFQSKRAGEIGERVESANTGKGWRRNSSCPLCGHTGLEKLFSRFSVDILKCLSCGCGFSAQFPVDSSDVYSNEGYLPMAKSDYLTNVTYRKQRFGQERLSLIREFSGREAKESRLLDIGCGTGWFLETAREEGFKITGQEVGKDLARFTAERLGIEVFECPITDIGEGKNFHVITLFDVIEHLEDPKASLEAVFRLLVPGGISLIFTPNLDSFGFTVLRQESSLVMPAEHLFYFTIPCLEKLLNDVGFELLQKTTQGMDIADIFSFYRDNLQEKETARFLREWNLELQAMIDQAGCANHMRFIVRKPLS